MTCRMLARSVTAVLAGALTALGLVTPAQAATGHNWRNLATQFCLDSNTAGQAYTMGCNSGNFQKWAWTGTYASGELRNVSTGLCLDSNTAGRVYTLGCNNGNFQRWTRSGQQWINVATQLCLDSNTSGSLYTLGCNSGSFQKWY